MPQKRGLISSGSTSDSLVIDRPEVLRRDDRMRRDDRRDLLVQVELPVHALGDRLDDQVAVLQLLEVLFVVGLLDQRGVFGHAERRGLELLQALDRLGDDAVLRPFLGRQVEQHHRHLDVDQMGGDLRAHHAGAEHGDLADVNRFMAAPARLIRRGSRSACGRTGRRSRAPQLLAAVDRLQRACRPCRCSGRGCRRRPTRPCRRRSASVAHDRHAEIGLSLRSSLHSSQTASCLPGRDLLDLAGETPPSR